MEVTKRSTNTKRPQRHQAYTTPPQANMQRGRFVEAKEIRLQASSQMMVASNTSHRTTIEHTVITEDTNKTRMMKLKSTYKKIHFPNLRSEISHIATEIKNKDFAKESALSSCLFVIIKIKSIERKFSTGNREVVPFIISEIGHYYSQYLDSALEYLKDKFATGCSWEYYKNLNFIMEYFKFHPDNPPYIKAHRETLVELHKTAIETELNYIKYTVNDPILKSTRNSLRIFHELCSKHSTALRHGFMTREDLHKYKEDLRTLQSIASDSDNNPTDSEITKKLDYLDNKNPCEGTIDSHTKRMYFDLLSEKLNLMSQGSSRNMEIDFHNRAFFLNNLTHMCDTYSHIINDLPLLTMVIAKIAKPISLNTMLAIEKKEAQEENVDHVKEELLNHISSLDKKGYLDENCQQLYSRCSQPKNLMRTDHYSDYQCKLRIDEIYSMLHGKYPEKFLTSARMLKELVDEKEHEITTMITGETTIKHIKIIKKRLYAQLFKPIFHSYNLYSKRNIGHYKMTKVLSIHKNEFIESNPYTFILHFETFRTAWRKIGCLILYHKVFELSYKKKIYEEDTKELLLMKSIMPEIPSQLIMKCVKAALLKCLQGIRDNVTFISVETANELSSWSDRLDRECHDNPELFSPNDQSKLANQTQTPHYPPLTQSTSANQTSIPPIPIMHRLSAQHPAQAFCQPPQTRYPLFQPTMPHTGYRTENPLNSGIPQTVTRPFGSPVGFSQLQSVESRGTPIPTQNKCYQSHLSFPPPFPPPLKSALSQQASCMSTTGCPIQRAMPQQYSPMHRNIFKIDNPTLNEGLQQLLKALNLYTTQKDKALHCSAPEDTLPSSDYSSLLENGMNLLTSWILHLEYLTIPRDEIYGSLMKLTNEDGHRIIFDLFNQILENIDDRKTTSDCFYLRNCLFSIRSSMGLGK